MICHRFCSSLRPVFVVFLLMSGTPFASAAPPAATPLTVTIAVPAKAPYQGKPGARIIDLRQEHSHFHVVVTNTSDKPLRLWETWNSWGYYNLRFEVADQKGNVVHAMTKKPRRWTVNFPSWIELAPGNQFVMDVDFDREVWDTPALKKNNQKEFSWRIRAIFEVKADKESIEHKVWTGKISSVLRDYVVRF